MTKAENIRNQCMKILDKYDADYHGVTVDRIDGTTYVIFKYYGGTNDTVDRNDDSWDEIYSLDGVTDVGYGEGYGKAVKGTQYYNNTDCLLVELDKSIVESKKHSIKYLKNITEKLKEDDLIQVTEENPVFPYWVYDTHRKVLNDIFDMCFYKKKFDIFVTNIGNGDKVEIYIVNDDMHVILAKDFANFVIHNINNANEYLTNLPYVSFYKTNVEIDGYVDKRYYGQFLKNFLDTVYKY